MRNFSIFASVNDVLLLKKCMFAEILQKSWSLYNQQLPQQSDFNHSSVKGLKRVLCCYALCCFRNALKIQKNASHSSGYVMERRIAHKVLMSKTVHVRIMAWNNATPQRTMHCVCLAAGSLQACSIVQ